MPHACLYESGTRTPPPFEPFISCENGECSYLSSYIHTVTDTRLHANACLSSQTHTHTHTHTQVLRFDHTKPNRDVGVGAHFDKIIGANGPEVRVVRLLDKGPAANSGEIHLGDILLTVNDAEVRDSVH